MRTLRALPHVPSLDRARQRLRHTEPSSPEARGALPDAHWVSRLVFEVRG